MPLQPTPTAWQIPCPLRQQRRISSSPRWRSVFCALAATRPLPASFRPLRSPWWVRLARQQPQQQIQQTRSSWRSLFSRSVWTQRVQNHRWGGRERTRRASLGYTTADSTSNDWESFSWIRPGSGIRGMIRVGQQNRIGLHGTGRVRDFEGTACRRRCSQLPGETHYPPTMYAVYCTSIKPLKKTCWRT